jgi:hypothetical protein
MSLGVQRGLSSNSLVAEQRRSPIEGPGCAQGAGVSATQPASNAVDASCDVPAAAPRADAETVQGARQRALGVGEQLRQQILQGAGWVEAHHRAGHIGKVTTKGQ